MDEYIIKGSTLTGIGNAIRRKTGGTALIDPEDMENEIDAISGGGGEQATPEIAVDENGLITATAGDKSATKQLSTQSGKTITPGPTEQIAVVAGTYVTEDIIVAAVQGGGSGGDTLPSKDTWEGVIARMDNGTYATEYAIGDTVPLDLGSEGVINMQIAAFDADDMSYNQGKAKISWVAKELLTTKHRMNPTYVSQTYGTGAVGGFKYCEMRTYLNDTIKPLIAESVASRIVAVTKHRNSHDGFGYEHQGIEDELWIPSTFEVAGVANNQYNGLVDHKYQALFPDANSRKKKRVGDADFMNWWASDISTAQYFNFFASSGAYSMADANSNYGVCLGFCTN